MVGELIKNIGRDIKTIAVDEMDLARGKLTSYIEQLVGKAATVLLGAVIAVIGFAMLCVVVVVALEPVIATLWLRLLIMSIVFIATGAAVCYLFTRHLGSLKPDLTKQVKEVGETIDAVQNGLAH